MLLTDKYTDKIYGTITCYDRMIIQVPNIVDGTVEGTIRYKKNGKYIYIAPYGSIVSFGKQ